MRSQNPAKENKNRKKQWIDVAGKTEEKYTAYAHTYIYYNRIRQGKAATEGGGLEYPQVDVSKLYFKEEKEEDEGEEEEEVMKGQLITRKT